MRAGNAFTPNTRPVVTITGDMEADSNTNLVAVTTDELPYGGGAIARILGNVGDLRGARVNIGWGWGSGASLDQPRWVISSRVISYEGRVATELVCADAWTMLQYSTRMNVATVDKIKGVTVPVLTQEDKGAGSPFTFNRELAIKAIVAYIIADENGFLAQQGLGGITELSTDTFYNEYIPLILTEINDDDRMILRRVFAMTQCAMYFRQDGAVVLFLEPDSEESVYSYDGSHPVFNSNRGRSLVIPNRVVFADGYPNLTVGVKATHVYLAEHLTSVAAIGALARIFADPTIASDDEAFTRTVGLFTHIISETHDGDLIAPMHCTQELYDVVEVTDPRGGDSYFERVGRIRRNYIAQTGNNPQRDAYTITLDWGGIGQLGD
jgi:hypothetical protein